MIYAGIIRPLARSINGTKSFQQVPPPNTRIVGPTTENTGTQQYPWLCSLRTRGYRGRHRCGVTLLSGPPERTILVSAAHCNYICKNKFGETLEICCVSPNLFLQMLLHICKNKFEETLEIILSDTGDMLLQE